MKKIILLVGLALLGVAAWYFWETKPKPNNELAKTPLPVKSQHSEAFNKATDTALKAYYSVSEALVNWDSAQVSQQITNLESTLQAIPMADLKDSVAQHAAAATLQSIKKDADAMQKAAGLEQKRRAFHALSQDMYDLLRTVRYDAATIYLQECPMAFNDEETGNWLSSQPAIRNPYLGLHHPKYKSGMLECGDTKDSIGMATVQK